MILDKQIDKKIKFCVVHCSLFNPHVIEITLIYKADSRKQTIIILVIRTENNAQGIYRHFP